MPCWSQPSKAGQSCRLLFQSLLRPLPGTLCSFFNQTAAVSALRGLTHQWQPQSDHTPTIKYSFIRSVLQSRHSTAKTCFVLFNLFHRGHKPTVTLSFVSNAVWLPCGTNVRLYRAVLVILPKYSLSGIIACRKKFMASHTWPLVEPQTLSQTLRSRQDETNCKFISVCKLSL